MECATVKHVTIFRVETIGPADDQQAEQEQKMIVARNDMLHTHIRISPNESPLAALAGSVRAASFNRH